MKGGIMVKKRKKQKVTRNLKDLKNINLLKSQIQDEISWLEEHFLTIKTPWVTIWANTNAEERFEKLQLRLEGFK